MEELLERLLKQNRLINKKEMEELIYLMIKEYELDKYIKKVVIPKNTFTNELGYYFDSLKKLSLKYNSIIKLCKELKLNIFESNKLIIHILLHEIVHVIQFKQFNEENNQFYTNIYITSKFIRSSLYGVFYQVNHECFPLEYNAEYKSSIILNNYLKEFKLEEDYKILLKLLDLYKINDDSIISPFSRLTKIETYNNESLENRIGYGLDITKEEYNYIRSMYEDREFKK